MAVGWDSSGIRNPNSKIPTESQLSARGFVCERPGTYIVSFSVESSLAQFASVQILLNGKPVGADGTLDDRLRNGSDLVSQSLIMNLKTGQDRIKISTSLTEKAKYTKHHLIIRTTGYPETIFLSVFDHFESIIFS